MGISGAAARGLPVAAVAVVMLTAGCAQPAEDADTSADELADAVASALAEADTDTSDGAEPPVPSATDKPDPRARAAVKAAILELLRANTGTYELSIPLGSGASISERGSYRIDPSAHEIIRTLGAPEGTMRVAGPEGQPPAAVVSASYAMGRRRLGSGSLDGTTDLALALA